MEDMPRDLVEHVVVCVGLTYVWPSGFPSAYYVSALPDGCVVGASDRRRYENEPTVWLIYRYRTVVVEPRQNRWMQSDIAGIRDTAY